MINIYNPLYTVKAFQKMMILHYRLIHLMAIIKMGEKGVSLFLRNKEKANKKIIKVVMIAPNPFHLLSLY